MLIVLLIVLFLLLFLFMAHCLTKSNNSYDQRVKDKEQMDFLAEYDHKIASKKLKKELSKDNEKHA